MDQSVISSDDLRFITSSFWSASRKRAATSERRRKRERKPKRRRDSAVRQRIQRASRHSAAFSRVLFLWGGGCRRLLAGAKSNKPPTKRLCRVSFARGDGPHVHTDVGAFVGMWRPRFPGTGQTHPRIERRIVAFQNRADPTGVPREHGRKGPAIRRLLLCEPRFRNNVKRPRHTLEEDEGVHGGGRQEEGKGRDPPRHPG